MKYHQVIKYERDMFTEIPAGAILESVHYRYLYFFEDGRAMYALTHGTPLEMIPRFVGMLLRGGPDDNGRRGGGGGGSGGSGSGGKDKWGVWGRYQIARDVVRVWVAHA